MTEARELINRKLVEGKLAELNISGMPVDKIVADGSVQVLGEFEVEDFGALSDLYMHGIAKVSAGFNDSTVLVSVDYSWVFFDGGRNGKTICYRYDIESGKWTIS